MAKMASLLDRVHNGDCLDWLAKIPEESVDLAFADPPFNIGYDYDVYNDKQDDRAYLDWSQQWIQAVARTLKPTGALWIAIGDEYAAELKTIAHRRVGLSLKSWVIWYYTFGVHCARNFARSHTHLFYFVKDFKNCTFNGDDIRVPSARMTTYGDRRAVAKGRLPDNTWILRPQDSPESFPPDTDTWYFSRVAGTFRERRGFHGCQMPEQLLGRIIRLCSQPRDVVLDPFAGSGTTLAVAKKLDRRFVGIELSSDYAARVGERLANIRAGDPLDGPAEPAISAPPTPDVVNPRKRAPNRKRGGDMDLFVNTEKE